MGRSDVRFAYADPPYIGKAKKHYGAQAKEVNHRVLIGTLCQEYPDGWALSCSSPSLRGLLALCPADVRVMAWVKSYAVFKPHVPVAYAWEPVIVRGGRKKKVRDRATQRVFDWMSAVPMLRHGVTGQKPDQFCFWLFAVLGANPTDEFHDIFPGSGAVGRAWDAFLRQRNLWDVA